MNTSTAAAAAIATASAAATAAPALTAVPLTPDVRPRVGPGFRLQWEAVQNCHVMLYPEGMVKLSQSAGEITKRCDGQHSIAEIVAELELAFGAQGLEAEVLAFIAMAGQQRWLVWK